MKIKHIVFDFGGVLVEWNPRYFYKDVFEKEEEMEYFLGNICTEKWNLQQDGGRPLAEAMQTLSEQYPDYERYIRMFYGESWGKMMAGEISENVEVLYELKKKNYPLYGLTNWSAETIPFAYERFAFFEEFDGIVVSGDEKMIKPAPAFYQILLDRYHLKAEECIFFDDNIHNIEAAEKLGFATVHIHSKMSLREELLKRNIL